MFSALMEAASTAAQSFSSGTVSAIGAASDLALIQQHLSLIKSALAQVQKTKQQLSSCPSEAFPANETLADTSLGRLTKAFELTEPSWDCRRVFCSKVRRLFALNSYH